MLATFNRSDTLLGICEALGEDVGFNPLWLRVALAVGMIWSPVAIARAVTPTEKRTVVAPLEERPGAWNDDEVQIMLAEAA